MLNSFRKLKIKLTIVLIYRSPNLKEEDNTKIQNGIKEISKGECIIMGDFNHGHIQWQSLESTGGEDQQFLFLTQDSVLTQNMLEKNQERKCIRYSFIITKRISGQCKNT